MGLSSRKQHLAPIAIVFELVNPVTSLWGFIDRGRKLWLDEMEFAIHEGHSSHLGNESLEVEFGFKRIYNSGGHLGTHCGQG